MVKISAIMPVYNTDESYLREAIESILAQTYKDFELIVVDDASQTDIKKIVKSYDDKRIIFFRLEQNCGASEARNFALDHAKGEYIAIMDSDDIAVPTRFEKQISYFEQHPEIGCLGGLTTVIGDDKDGLEFPKLKTNEEIEAFLTFKGCAFCHSTIMLKKELLDKNKIRYQKQYILAEDYALYVDLMDKTKFAIMDDILLSYRFHFGNITHKKMHLLQSSTTKVQMNAIKKYCNLGDCNFEILSKFFEKQLLNNEEMEELNKLILLIIQQTPDQRRPLVLPLLQKRLKKQYYKNHSFSGQVTLWNSPLNKTLKIGIIFRMFYFLTRGILSFKK